LRALPVARLAVRLVVVAARVTAAPASAAVFSTASTARVVREGLGAARLAARGFAGALGLSAEAAGAAAVLRGALPVVALVVVALADVLRGARRRGVGAGLGVGVAPGVSVSSAMSRSRLFGSRP
jgi:hypothetical protein